MSFEIEACFYVPDHFYNKEVNESFIKFVMGQALSSKSEDWMKGDPDKFEPDYFYRGSPFEFTLASDRKKKKNMIQRFMSHEYTSNNLEADVMQYISASIQAKAPKTYSVDNVHLCVLCILEMFDWVSDEYGSVTQFLFDDVRHKFFEDLRNTYIDTGKFANIFLIFPDLPAKWWVWDIKSNIKKSVQLTDSMIREKKYPFVFPQALRNEIEKLFANEKEENKCP